MSFKVNIIRRQWSLRCRQCRQLMWIWASSSLICTSGYPPFRQILFVKTSLISLVPGSWRNMTVRLGLLNEILLTRVQGRHWDQPCILPWLRPRDVSTEHGCDKIMSELVFANQEQLRHGLELRWQGSCVYLLYIFFISLEWLQMSNFWSSCWKEGIYVVATVACNGPLQSFPRAL